MSLPCRIKSVENPGPPERIMVRLTTRSDDLTNSNNQWEKPTNIDEYNFIVRDRSAFLCVCVCWCVFAIF